MLSISSQKNAPKSNQSSWILCPHPHHHASLNGQGVCCPEELLVLIHIVTLRQISPAWGSIKPTFLGKEAHGRIHKVDMVRPHGDFVWGDDCVEMRRVKSRSRPRLRPETARSTFLVEQPQ